MRLIIATQKHEGQEIKRAFIKEDHSKYRKSMNELSMLGWYDIQCIEVDNIMYNQLELSSERK